MEKVRAAIIGCGGIANGKHMPSLKELGDRVEIVAFCDIIRERAEKAKAEYGTPDAKVYENYKELLEDKSIDTVHVCTPNRSHSFISIDAMEAGKHVICEKPMAKTYAEAKAMTECARRTGKILTIGYQNRYRADSQYLKTMCDAGDLGEIYYARALALRRRAVPTWGVFTNEYEQGGGPLIDIGTHSLDLTLWMMDNYKPKMVLGSTFRKLADNKEQGNPWGNWDPTVFTVEDSAFGYIIMENGAAISLETSWALNALEIGEAQTLLCGTKAGADMRDGLRINGIHHNKQYIERPDLRGSGVAFFGTNSTNESVIECATFLSAVTDGTELVVKPEQAMVVTQILEGVYNSAKLGGTYMFEK